MTRLIVEADGGSRGNPGPAAYGALVRSADSGEVLAEVGETIGVATNNVAEYRGLIAGLRMAHAIDADAEVEARLDSKLVVEQMSGRWKIKHADMRPLALEAQRIFAPGRVTYTWVPRAQNAHADRLLNEALDGTSESAPAVTETREEPSGDPSGELHGEPPPQPHTPEHTPPDTSPHTHPASWARELGPPTTLLLVRHGQTELTKARVFSGGGRPGPPLDDAGLQQAKRAADALAESDAVADVPVVIASPVQRTRETADVIASRLGSDPVVVDEQWRECHFGAWDGLTLAEVSEQFPDELQQWFGSATSQPPGGESLDELAARIVEARDRVVKQHPGRTVVVVTHSMPIRLLVRLALDAPSSATFRLRPAPGSITEIQYYSDGGTALAGFNLRP